MALLTGAGGYDLASWGTTLYPRRPCSIMTTSSHGDFSVSVTASMTAAMHSLVLLNSQTEVRYFN